MPAGQVPGARLSRPFGRDLERDRHAAARQAEHDRAAAVQEPKVGRELPPRVRPVCEVHGTSRYQISGAIPWDGKTAFWVAMIAWSTGSPGSKPHSIGR